MDISDSLALASRKAKRRRVLMTGTLFTPDGVHKVLIRDISTKGAQVVPESAIQANCDAILKRGSIFAAVRVAWSADREAGLRFYRDLTPAEVKSTFQPVIRG